MSDYHYPPMSCCGGLVFHADNCHEKSNDTSLNCNVSRMIAQDVYQMRKSPLTTNQNVCISDLNNSVVQPTQHNLGVTQMNTPVAGQTVLYRQGRGEFEATVVSVDSTASTVVLKRTTDGKTVSRPFAKLYPTN